MTTGFIYAIKSKLTDKIYIGSTVETLAQRFSQHKTNARHKTNACYSQEIIKYGDAEIELLEEIEFNDKDELLWKEREYMEIFKDQCINKNRAITTEEENKQRRREYHKEYYQQNKQRLKECQKEYYQRKKMIN